MGIKERKIKHKEDLKQSILDAAKKLFQEDGYQATSIRKIAAEIEFSPTTIYLYYKDKQEIAHALHEEGFKILSDRFRLLANIDSPFERLKAMGRIYIQFALENRDYYDIMFVMKDPIQHICEGPQEEEWTEGATAFFALVETIKSCQEEGYFKAYDPETLSLLVWSTMHGLCTLKLDGRMDMVVSHKQILTDVPDVLQHTFSIYIKMLERL
ncbi:TetR/AcrR family transcriptional regulator [Pollutibacter soli]|uniref:TetR/AcrR family transcriptional regulator n=1 Tax=Pollutibacter soli TaxID=3034157 RepID=UPI003013BB54